MIDINLIPNQLRKKKKSGILIGGLSIPLEVIVGSVVALMMFLIIVHVFLLFTNISKLAKHKALKAKWETVSPQKKKVDAVLSELRFLQNQYKAIDGITIGREVVWSQKLNIISDSLPRGAWLRKIVLSGDIFYIEGSAISKQGDEMITVHKFTSNLKDDDVFLNRLTEFELGSIQRRKIKKIDIADFLITTKLK